MQKILVLLLVTFAIGVLSPQIQAAPRTLADTTSQIVAKKKKFPKHPKKKRHPRHHRTLCHPMPIR